MSHRKKIWLKVKGGKGGREKLESDWLQVKKLCWISICVYVLERESGEKVGFQLALWRSILQSYIFTPIEVHHSQFCFNMKHPGYKR